jgi:hypothetical protein
MAMVPEQCRLRQLRFSMFFPAWMIAQAHG